MSELAKSDSTFFLKKVTELRDQIVEAARDMCGEVPLSSAMMVIVDADEESDSIVIMMNSCADMIGQMEDELSASNCSALGTLLDAVKRHSTRPSAGLLRVVVVTGGRVLAGRVGLSSNPQC